MCQLIALLSSLACSSMASEQHNAGFDDDKSGFGALKSRIFAEPYQVLPQYKVNKKHFGPSGDRPDNHLLQAARRTLVSDADFIEFPQGQKLLNANGICFAGQWTIDGESGYTGLFAKGVRANIIARASVALSGTGQNDKRAFGMAIKFLPASNDTKTPRRNIFVMHSLSGVRTQHVLNLALDNEPALGGLPAWSQIGTALRLRKDLERADREQGTVPPRLAYRSISHLAQDLSGSLVKDNAPKWIRLRAADTMPRIDAYDFRDELNVRHYPGNQMVWQIEVAAGDRQSKKNARWRRLGRIVFTESVTSKVCDQNLHFGHPSAR